MTATTVASARASRSANSSARLLSAKELAAHLGFSTGYVYEHADALAVIRLPGRRGRLRFDLQRTLAALESARVGGEPSHGPESTVFAEPPMSRRPASASSRVRLLPPRGVNGA